MFVLIRGDKGRYDGDISMSIVSKGTVKGGISTELFQIVADDLNNRCEDEYLDAATKQLMNKENFIKVDEYTSVSVSYDRNGNITYYSIGCPSDNEYQGFTYQVLEV